MSPKLHDPDSHERITSSGEFERAARRMAGIQEWDMDDPERPFTEEYDPPKAEAADEPQATTTAPLSQETEPEDTTPSADNRDLYRQPTPARLSEIRKQTALQHIRELKLIVRAAQEKDEKDIKTSA